MAEIYPWLKQLHVSTVVISGMLFLLRYGWMLQQSLQHRGRWVGILPHVIDTALLISGLAMATLIQQFPFSDGWLSAKLFALLSYIILGSIALKRGRTRQIRRWAGIAAMLCYLYIINVALSRSPLPAPGDLLAPLIG